MPSFSLPPAFDHPAITNFVLRGDHASVLGEPASFALLGPQDSSCLPERDFRALSTLLDALYTALRSQEAANPGASQ